MAIHVDHLSECLRHQKCVEEEEEKEGTPWRDPAWHVKLTEEVADTETKFQWLEKADPKDSTKALIMAAQEKAFNTRPHQAGLKVQILQLLRLGHFLIFAIFY